MHTRDDIDKPRENEGLFDKDNQKVYYGGDTALIKGYEFLFVCFEVQTTRRKKNSEKIGTGFEVVSVGFGGGEGSMYRVWQNVAVR